MRCRLYVALRPCRAALRELEIMRPAPEEGSRVVEDLLPTFASQRSLVCRESPTEQETNAEDV